MVYYGIKFTLTSGEILEFEGEETSAGGTSYVYDGEPGHWRSTQYVVGKNAFATKSLAQQAAMAARDKKIASLRNQIAKLEAMGFTP